MIPSNIKNKLEGMERRSILRSNTKLEITGLFFLPQDTTLTTINFFHIWTAIRNKLLMN